MSQARRIRQQRIPLIRRRGGLKILLTFVQPLLHYYGGERGPEEITEWDLDNYASLHPAVRCKVCNDSGFMGAGPLAPMTGMECHSCDVAAKQSEHNAYVRGLEERVRNLEALLADRALGK